MLDLLVCLQNLFLSTNVPSSTLNVIFFFFFFKKTGSVVLWTVSYFDLADYLLILSFLKFRYPPYCL